MEQLSKFTAFRFDGLEIIDGREVNFAYSFQDGPSFTEKIIFPFAVDSPALRSLLELYHLAAGVSYYKAYPCKQFAHNYHISPDAAAFLNSHYTLGLAEFIFENKLHFADMAQFEANASPAASADKVQTGSQKYLIAIGGGKDSLVTVETYQKPAELFRVNPTGLILKQAELSGLKLNSVQRAIDQKLLQINKQDALNGHVPITNLVSLLGVVTASAGGYNDLILSNENSADIPNLEYDGRSINHQYSKSREARALLNRALTELGYGDDRVKSHLQDLNELEIAYLFTKKCLPKYSGAWNSSNQNFAIGADSSEWQWSSPKTLSVFALMAAFLAKKSLQDEFGIESYDPFTENKDTWLKLVGQKDYKPFECVATINEMQTAVCAVDTTDWPGAVNFQDLLDCSNNRLNIEESAVLQKLGA